MKFLSHIYSYIIYKITKLQTQKKLKQRRYDQKTKSALETSDAWISLNTSPNDMKFFSHIYSYIIYKITKLQTQKKLKQRRYDQKTRSALETSDAWISLNTSPNDMKFLSHIYSYMIYKITKLQTQKSLNKGDMTKKPDLHLKLQMLRSFSIQVQMT